MTNAEVSNCFWTLQVKEISLTFSFSVFSVYWSVKNFGLDGKMGAVPPLTNHREASVVCLSRCLEVSGGVGDEDCEDAKDVAHDSTADYFLL